MMKVWYNKDGQQVCVVASDLIVEDGMVSVTRVSDFELEEFLLEDLIEIDGRA